MNDREIIGIKAFGEKRLITFKASFGQSADQYWVGMYGVQQIAFGNSNSFAPVSWLECDDRPTAEPGAIAVWRFRKLKMAFVDPALLKWVDDNPSEAVKKLKPRTFLQKIKNLFS